MLAAGIAADEGRIDIDVPLGEYLPDFVLGTGVEHVTMQQLLGMISGIDFPWSATIMTDWPDLTREFFVRPSCGRVFQYSNASTGNGGRGCECLASYTVVQAAGHRGGGVGSLPEWMDIRWRGVVSEYWRACPDGAVNP